MRWISLLQGTVLFTALFVFFSLLTGFSTWPKLLEICPWLAGASLAADLLATRLP